MINNQKIKKGDVKKYEAQEDKAVIIDYGSGTGI